MSVEAASECVKSSDKFGVQRLMALYRAAGLDRRMSRDDPDMTSPLGPSG